MASALERRFLFLLDLLYKNYLYMCCYLGRESKSAVFPVAIDPWECVLHPLHGSSEQYWFPHINFSSREVVIEACTVTILFFILRVSVDHHML